MAVAGLAAVSLALFGEFLFGGGNAFPSHGFGDTVNYFLGARRFAVEQLLQGNLPLWNPHLFGGYPFIASFSFYHSASVFTRHKHRNHLP